MYVIRVKERFGELPDRTILEEGFEKYLNKTKREARVKTRTRMKVGVWRENISKRDYDHVRLVLN